MCIAAVAGIALNKEVSVSSSDIALANIEAIMGSENNNAETQFEKCTRAIAWADCYRKNTQNNRWEWCCLRTTAVETYYKTSCVVVCRHDVITQCSHGCEEI